MGRNSASPHRCVGRLTRAVAVVLPAVVAASAFLAGPAQAASGPHVAVVAIKPADVRAQAAGSSEECFYTLPDCASSDLTVEFDMASVGNTTGCTFENTTTWGDGTSTTQTYPGGADGSILAAYQHTYAAQPGIYTVTVAGGSTGESPGGACSDPPTTLQFTLTASGQTAQTITFTSTAPTRPPRQMPVRSCRG
jgi:hypothetical protein